MLCVHGSRDHSRNAAPKQHGLCHTQHRSVRLSWHATISACSGADPWRTPANPEFYQSKGDLSLGPAFYLTSCHHDRAEIRRRIFQITAFSCNHIGSNVLSLLVFLMRHFSRSMEFHVRFPPEYPGRDRFAYGKVLQVINYCAVSVRRIHKKSVNTWQTSTVWVVLRRVENTGQASLGKEQSPANL